MPRQLARGAALLAATFLLGALLAAGWQHESCSLLWLLLPLGALGALVGAHRLSPWDARIALGLGALALVPRLVCEHLPANFYTDLLGPDGIDVHLRRPGGYAGFYRMLSGLFPVGPATIFGASVLSSTLAVVLAALALRDGGVCRHLPRHTWVLWGLLLAFDPLLAAIGASDASHNVALLAFGLTLFYHRDAAENGAHPLHLVALVVFAALVGLTRPEMIPTPLVCLLLVAGDAGSRRRLAWPALATVAGVALSVWFWSGQDLGAVVRPIDASSLNARTLGQLAGLTNVYPARGPTSGLDVQHALFAGLSVVLVAFAIVERRWSLLAIPVSYFFVGLPRLATDFHSDHQIGSNMATARYSLVPMALLLLLAAGGAGASWMLLSRAAEALGASRRIRVAGGTALIGLAVLAWIGHGAITGRLYASQHLPYREEYRLLARALPHLPQGSRIAVHYAAHFPSRRHDPDTSLGVPHALLAFLRPDVRFVVLGPLDDPPACERCYYFVGAMCNLDIAHVRADATPEDSAFLASLQSACDRGRALVSAPVARAEHASDVIFWRLKENRVRLLLGPTADTRQHGGSTESAP
jgi:hypothetical protein